MQSLSQVMARLALVLILGISTMSCSVHLQRVELEFSSQSVGDSYKWQVKDSIRVFDLSDDLSYKSKVNFTLNHFNERLNIYNEEQFNYKIDRIKL